jgi:hypothetical protein
MNYSDDTDYQETQFSCLYSLLNSLITLEKYDEIEKLWSKITELESSERIFVKYYLCLIKLKWFRNVEKYNDQAIRTNHLLLEYGSQLDDLLSIQ